MRLLRSLAAVALCAAAAAASDPGVKVIANPGVAASSISPDEIKGIFLMTRTSLGDGGRVEPVLEKGGPAHEIFLRTYLGKADAALQTYYRSLVFTGKGSMPKELATDADVVAYVARTKGAIGYVGSGAATAGVKTLEVR